MSCRLCVADQAEISCNAGLPSRCFIPTFYVQTYLWPESAHRRLPNLINKQPHNEKAAEVQEQPTLRADAHVLDRLDVLRLEPGQAAMQPAPPPIQQGRLEQDLLRAHGWPRRCMVRWVALFWGSLPEQGLKLEGESLLQPANLFAVVVANGYIDCKDNDGPYGCKGNHGRWHVVQCWAQTPEAGLHADGRHHYLSTPA